MTNRPREVDMKLRVLVLLAVSGALLLGASSAAARTSFPSTITHVGSESVGGGKFVDSGRVTSPKSACTRLRLVKLVGKLPNGTKGPLDFDLTSFKGAWATTAPHAPFAKITATAVKERLHHGRIVCKPASVVVYRAP
jgi:hypothetical protein